MGKYRKIISMIFGILGAVVLLLAFSKISWREDVISEKMLAKTSIKNKKEGIGLLGNKNQRIFSSGFFELKNSIEVQLKESENNVQEFSGARIGITSHHLPTAASLISNFYQTLKKSNPEPKTVVVIGPDHFEKCIGYVATTGGIFETPFGRLETNQKIVNELKEKVAREDNCFEGEHSMGVHEVFVKKVFPRAKIVPIVLSSGTTKEEVEKIFEILKNNLENRVDEILVIASVDFSHYHKVEYARILENESEEKILEMDENFFDQEHVDSPASVEIILKLARYFDLKPAVIEKKNSSDWTGETKNTTGYLSVVFL